MRQRGISRLIGWMRSRPVVAAIVVSALSLAVIGGVVVRIISLRSVATRTSPTPSAAIQFPSFSPFGNPASSTYAPVGNSASGSYPPNGNSASGPYPPVGEPATGSYPPFYPPATPGSTYSTPVVNCRLPVFAGGPGSGGFVVFPGGTFIADPTSSVALPSPSVTPSPSPVGPGYGPSFSGLSYDRKYSRWLPVPIGWVTPDESRYAYPAADGIYAVDVANDKQTEVGAGQDWTIVAVENDRVYAGKQGGAGLWLLPFSGTPHQITTAGYWQAAARDAAYGTVTAAVPQGAANTILRLDLKTGTTIDWFTRVGAQSAVVGFDGNGNPIILVNYVNVSFNEIWITKSATSASPIAGYSYPRYTQGFNASGAPISDRNGVWFAGSSYSGSGLALYLAGSGLYWMSSIGGQLAGGCY